MWEKLWNSWLVQESDHQDLEKLKEPGKFALCGDLMNEYEMGHDDLELQNAPGNGPRYLGSESGSE